MSFHLKAPPFALTIQILPSLYRLLKPRLGKQRLRASVQASTKPQATALAALFKYHITQSLAIITDLDINIHKANSTFFVDAGINRAALLTAIFKSFPSKFGVLNGPGAVLKDENYRKTVFATVASKYVSKAGRTTVPREVVLRSTGLLVS
ncbi:hypothetical protein HD806DRAFT_539941 [Xylariaceae sp. AK1471]|nr:hypothetical protein HD806DRAFT_539941 [Xylariaceae sp. AK1471]